MDMVVLCSPAILSLDLGKTEDVLLRQLLQVMPSIPGDREQMLERSPLGLVKKKKDRWQICLLNKFINRIYVENSHYFYVRALHTIPHVNTE